MSLPGIDASATSIGAFSAATMHELGAPSCTAAVALRRVTTLLQGARRADAQGEIQQARELYSEVLKVQKGLARAPLGSIGKSLREVASSVEARLINLREPGDDFEGGASSSRPPTSSGRLTTSFAGGDELSLTACSPRSPKVISTTQWSSGGTPWTSTVLTLKECPLSARPTTRDGNRPGTQDGAGRWRVGSFDGTRPTTRDDSRQQSLDGLRPSTRDGARLQQMIDGGNRGLGARPTTRDGVRPPTRGGTGERRAQDVSIRQVTGRKKRHSSQHAPEYLTFDGSSSASPEPRPSITDWPVPECLSPCIDADESVDLE
jgi:hypothetical protein